MQTIMLHMPDDLAQKVSRLSGNVESFIIDLVRSRVNEISNPSLSLADQYRMAAEENKSLQNDFKAIDMEGWGDEY